MKPDTVEFLKGVGWALLCVFLALLFWAVSSPAHAQEERQLTAVCDKEKGKCIVDAAELMALVQNNNLGGEVAERAAAEVKALKEAQPKCGALEVVPKAPVKRGTST